MTMRTEYVRNFYADHQPNFGQPGGTPAADVRAAALREFDEWLRSVKADARGEGCDHRSGGDDRPPLFYTAIGPWHRWFAWRPVDTITHGWVWLRAVERRRIQTKISLPGPINQGWQYRKAGQ